MFTDTHCHIFKEDYDEPHIIIKKALKNNIKRIIISGYDYNSNKEALDLSKKHKEVYVTLGQHPCNLENFDENIIFIQKNINFRKVLGIGEIGLDYHYNNTYKKNQLTVFNKMMHLAKIYNKPVIIHTRDAQVDTLKVLKNYRIKGIIHSFSDDLKMAKEYIKLGYLLGINGILTFKNSNLSSTLKNVSLNKILLETDSPYLAPEPLRSRKNEPSNLILTAKRLSEIYEIDLQKLSETLENNLLSIFDIN